MLKKALKFLQLTDRAGDLSITNIAVIVLITKMALAPLDWVTAAGLLITLLNYGHKRIEANKAAKEAAAVAKTTAMAITVKNLQEQMSKQQAINDDIIKIAEDAKSAISKSNLAGAFTPVFKRDK